MYSSTIVKFIIRINYISLKVQRTILFNDYRTDLTGD